MGSVFRIRHERRPLTGSPWRIRRAFVTLTVGLVLGMLGGTLGQSEHAWADKSPAARDQKDLVHALQKGGYVIYLRHGKTDNSQIDAARVDFANCVTQRNLSVEGRKQAQVVGKAFADLGIKAARVIASPYCRCRDTGILAFGEVIVDDDLAFAIRKPKEETKRLADHLRKLLATKPPEGANTVVIAHTANLKEAAGIWPKPEAVAHIFQPHGDGGFSHVGMILPEEWTELARVK